MTGVAPPFLSSPAPLLTPLPCQAPEPIRRINPSVLKVGVRFTGAAVCVVMSWVELGAMLPTVDEASEAAAAEVLDTTLKFMPVDVDDAGDPCAPAWQEAEGADVEAD